MMLYIAPETIRMKKAARDLNPKQPGGLRAIRKEKVRIPLQAPGAIPTLATREKGQAVVESLMATILKDIEDLRQTALPAAK